MNWITQHALGWLLAALPIGSITFVAGQYIKKASNWVDGRDATFKRLVLLPAIAAVVTALGAAAHINVVCDPSANCLTQLDGSTLDAGVKALLGVIVAFIAHAGKAGNTSAPPPA